MFSKYKRFNQNEVNDLIFLIDENLEKSKELFPDKIFYYEDIVNDIEMSDLFLKKINNINKNSLFYVERINALRKSYSILFENAIMLDNSESYFDIIYSMIEEIPNKLSSMIDTSQILIKINTNNNNKWIDSYTIKYIEEPQRRGSFYFVKNYTS